MSDVKCPYCGEDNEICHDDGYGYEEDKTHEQDCYHCEKTFAFNTAIYFSYEVFCKDTEHDFDECEYEAKNGDILLMKQCKNCDHTESEKVNLQNQRGG